MIEVNNLGHFHLRMIRINWVSMESDWLMGVCLNTMPVLLTAVIVLRIQMRMRRCPLEHHKGGKQKENESCVETSLDHDGIKFGMIACIVHQQC